MKVVAIIQARMNSTRLPGKVLMPLLNRPILSWVIDRTNQVKDMEILVATTTDSSDDVLCDLICANGIYCVRGNMDDVLERYYFAVKKIGAEVIVRITADCPFVDASIIKKVLKHLIKEKLDYVSNTLVRTYPRGADVEAFTISALNIAYLESSKTFEREHVTPYIWMHPEIFRIKNILAPSYLRRPDLRLTVDTIEDYNLAYTLYEKLGYGLAPLKNVIELINNNPELKSINNHIKQKSILNN